MANCAIAWRKAACSSIPIEPLRMQQEMPTDLSHRRALPSGRDFYLITCEHGGNRIPSPYRELFCGHEHLLRTHRALDFGALRVARELAAALSAPLVVSTVSRLLVDLNRSIGHPRLFSEATRSAGRDVRQKILSQHYLPYRTRVEAAVAQQAARGRRVIHVSCHSFTPELHGEIRNADIGLLYDPARTDEANLCRHWQSLLKEHTPKLKTRLNYPYAGTADGLTTYLRRRFPMENYLGIELEINQKHAQERGEHWRAVRLAVIEAFSLAAKGAGAS